VPEALIVHRSVHPFLGHGSYGESASKNCRSPFSASDRFGLVCLLDRLVPLRNGSKKIMKMRFGLEDGSEHTLEEVGRSFAVTRERIRQIEAKALRKLRQPSRSCKLKAFLVDVHE